MSDTKNNLMDALTKEVNCISGLKEEAKHLRDILGELGHTNTIIRLTEQAEESLKAAERNYALLESYKKVVDGDHDPSAEPAPAESKPLLSTIAKAAWNAALAKYEDNPTRKKNDACSIRVKILLDHLSGVHWSKLEVFPLQVEDFAFPVGLVGKSCTWVAQNVLSKQNGIMEKFLDAVFL